MPTVAVNGIELCYETFGSPSDPPLLLVTGLGGQMTNWADGFCQRLADGGRYVIRFDNRDSGLSTHHHGVQVDVMAVMTAAFSGTPMPEVPYTLRTMADDAFGLLDALGLQQVHLVGSSMGGMIVQQMAIDRPQRVLTLTSVMSTTGEREHFLSSAAANAAMGTPTPTEREAYIADAVERQRLWSSKRYFDPLVAAAQIGAAYDRAFDPAGTQRQLVAIRASGDRADGLRALRVPTLVIHGRDDELVLPTGGFRTAELVEGSVLLYVSDMGHDRPEPLWPVLCDAILSHTGR